MHLFWLNFSFLIWILVYSVPCSVRMLLRSDCVVAHIPLQSLVKMYWDNLGYPQMTAVPLMFGGVMSISTWILLGCLLIYCHDIISWKKGDAYKPKCTFIKMTSAIPSTLACYWIIHLFFSGACLPLQLLQIVVLWILDMMIFYPILNYDGLSSQLSVWDISCLLILVEYYLASVDR